MFRILVNLIDADHPIPNGREAKSAILSHTIGRQINCASLTISKMRKKYHFVIFRKSTRARGYGAPSSVASSYMPGYGASDFRGISNLVEKYFDQTEAKNISKSQTRRYKQLQGISLSRKPEEILVALD